MVHRPASRWHAVYIQCVYSPYRCIQTYIQCVQPIYSHIKCIYSPYAAHAHSSTQPMRGSEASEGHAARLRHAVDIQCAYLYSPYSSIKNTYRAHCPYTAIYSPYTVHTEPKRITVDIPCGAADGRVDGAPAVCNPLVVKEPK